MIEKVNNNLYPFITIGFLILVITTCKKDDTIPYNPSNGNTTAVFNPKKRYGSVQDIDGNVYKTIIIGTQTWMAENLRTTRYRNGDTIPNVVDNVKWEKLSSGALCNYKNTNRIDSIATFGRLYNWFAVSDNRNICPSGWHVPSAAEWQTLENYLGIEDAGGKLKEVNLTHWNDPNTGATNESGFTALPGGIYYGGAMNSLGICGSWWSSTEDVAPYAFARCLFSDISGFASTSATRTIGCSVRLIKD